MGKDESGLSGKTDGTCILSTHSAKWRVSLL